MSCALQTHAIATGRGNHIYASSGGRTQTTQRGIKQATQRRICQATRRRIYQATRRVVSQATRRQISRIKAKKSKRHAACVWKPCRTFDCCRAGTSAAVVYASCANWCSGSKPRTPAVLCAAPHSMQSRWIEYQIARNRTRYLPKATATLGKVDVATSDLSRTWFLLQMYSGPPRTETGHTRRFSTGTARILSAGYARILSAGYARILSAGYARILSAGYARILSAGHARIWLAGQARLTLPGSWRIFLRLNSEDWRGLVGWRGSRVCGRTLLRPTAWRRQA